MLGGQIAAGIASVPGFIEYQKTGKARIAAAIGARRDPLRPQVPTFTELGFENLTDYPWYGVFAPVDTPQAAVDRFGAALRKVRAMPDVKRKLTGPGLRAAHEPQGQFTGRMRSHTQTGEDIIRASGFQPP